MDFNGLSRRELQALCKRFQLPANLTNVSMADSLNALQSVEGVDEVLQACQSEIAQLSTGGRSTSRRNTANKIDSALKECAEEGRKDVLLTPAPLGATSRRKAIKIDSAVKQVYSVRRSARLAAKSGDLSRKDLFTGHGQEFEMNLKESLDVSDELSGVTVMEENIERKTEELVDSVSTNAESLTKIEEDMHIHSETEGLTETSSELLNEVNNTNLHFPKKDLSIDDGLLLLKESQEGVGVISGVTVMEKNFERKDEELVDSVSANAESLPRIEHMIIHFETEGLTENHLKLLKKVDDKKIDFPKKDLSNDDCLVLLKESPGGLDVISKVASLDEVVISEVASLDEEKKGEARVDSSDKQDSPIYSSNANVPNAELNKSCSEIGGSGDEYVTENEADLSETESNPNESDSATLELTEGSANSSDSLDCMYSEISSMSYKDNAFDWGSTQDVDDTKDTNQVHAIEEETETAVKPTTDATTLDEVSPNPTIHLTDAKLSVEAGDSNATPLPFFIGSDPSYMAMPTLSTPKIASASNAYSRMLGISAASDNKENIGSGSKTAPARGRSRMVKEISEAVPKLDDRALVQLLKDLKGLQINLKFDKNENEVRAALQPLSENHRDV